jgi:hypothetical protein
MDLGKLERDVNLENKPPGFNEKMRGNGMPKHLHPFVQQVCV